MNRIYNGLLALARKITLSAIALSGLSFGFAPLYVLYTVAPEDLDGLSFGKSATLTLLLMSCLAMCPGLYFLYRWLNKRWSM